MKELFLKPLRIIFAPVIITLKKQKHFNFDGESYPLFYHKYNITWATERAVEIPIARGLIKKYSPKKILEIGNVLSHYYKTNWDVLDKYEVGKGIIKEDILKFKPKEKYDFIISISTFEHIGYDDELGEGDSQDKILKSLENLEKNSLKKGGMIYFTVPIGYNPSMDKIIFNKKWKFESIKYLKKVSLSSWKEVDEETAKKSKFASPYPYGNCIALILIKK